MFFNFPEDWQEWFIKHPEMLSSGDEPLFLEQIRELLYDKIVTIIRRNEGEEVESILPYVTLLILSGLEHAEVYKNIRTRSTRK